MTFIKPDKPAKLRGMRGVMTITTNAASKDADGMYVPGAATNTLSVPARLDVMSPGEAVRMGHDTDETVYRLRCNVRHQDGADIRITHDQRLTITSPEHPSGGKFVVIGRGHSQGRSGIQTVIVKLENR